MERRDLLEADGLRAFAVFAADGARRADDFLGELHAGPATLTVAAGRGAFRWVTCCGTTRRRSA